MNWILRGRGLSGRRLTDGNEEEQDKYHSVGQLVSVLRRRFEPGITQHIRSMLCLSQPIRRSC
jgi:hypothetical protein